LLEFADLLAINVMERIAALYPSLEKASAEEAELSTDQIANRLGVCTLTVRNWAKAGCPHFTVGKGRKRFDLTAVKAWLAARDGGAK
jgi:excisionase family DNA binding protein